MKKITATLPMDIAFEQKYQVHRKEGYTRIMLHFINMSTEETT